MSFPTEPDHERVKAGAVGASVLLQGQSLDLY